MTWLFKEEPTNYSYDALVRDGTTTWTGVRNPLAQKHLRSVAKGDRIFFYHTGAEKSVVGIMKAAGDAYPDPADKTGKLYAVDTSADLSIPAAWQACTNNLPGTGAPLTIADPTGPISSNRFYRVRLLPP